MDTQLADWAQKSPQAQEAADIIRRCVHCGFCTATCPTYQLLGDERDGPRGRIYLIKQLLEGQDVGEETQTHLDRCLTCRSCETTCPSGVAYGRLADIGRGLVEQQVKRPLAQRAVRFALREGLTSSLFGPAMWVGRQVRSLLPAVLKEKVPVSRPAAPALPIESAPALASAPQYRQVILPKGCVQPSLLPSIDAATQRVLARLGIEAIVPREGGCCGALRHHLADASGGHADMRRNIQAWAPLLQQNDRLAVLMNASGCGVMVKEYGHLFESDPRDAERAQLVSDRTLDPVELLMPYAPVLAERLAARRASWPKIAYHTPCTQQHGLRLKGHVEKLLVAIGVQLTPVPDAHLCCGSAGTYSVLQPELSHELRDRKLSALQSGGAGLLLSANIGCLTHLEAASGTPILHWLEWLDQELSQA